MYSFPNLESIHFSMSCSVASSPAYRFIGRQVKWSGILISWRIFQFVVIHTAKDFSVVDAEGDVFLECLCFFYDPVAVGSLISGSSAFSKFSLYMGKFAVHILLKPSFKNFEHYLASMWNECSCVVVWTHINRVFSLFSIMGYYRTLS